MGLWTVAGSYSMAYKEDGFVPLWFVKGFPRGEQYAASLVKANLWDAAEKRGQQGWQFKDWTDYQPTSEEIEAERVKARERQRERRKRLREGKPSDGKAALTVVDVTPDVTAYVTRDTPHDVQRESRDPVPTRPDPSRFSWSRFVGDMQMETFHHVVAYVTRGFPDGMMTLRASGVTA